MENEKNMEQAAEVVTFRDLVLNEKMTHRSVEEEKRVNQEAILPHHQNIHLQPQHPNR